MPFVINSDSDLQIGQTYLTSSKITTTDYQYIINLWYK